MSSLIRLKINHLYKTTQTASLSAPAAAAGLSAWLQRCMQQQLRRPQQRQAANCRSGVAKSRTALDGHLSPYGYVLGQRNDEQAVLMSSTGTIQALHLVHAMVLEKPKWKRARAAPKPLPTAQAAQQDTELTAMQGRPGGPEVNEFLL